MDWTQIIVAVIAAAAGAVTGGSVAIAVLFYRQERDKRKAEAAHRRAEADDVTTGTLSGIIAVLREEVDRMRGRIDMLEVRVNAVESENRTLSRLVEQFRLLVKRLWAVICEADLETDPDLVEAVYEALEDSCE